MPGVSDFDSRNYGKKNRRSLEIVWEILVVVSGSARKTRIMYQANSSYPLLEKYLRSLLENGLLRCYDRSCYLITERGKEFLQMYDEYVERRRRIQEEIYGFDKDRLLLENMCFNGEFRRRRVSSRARAGWCAVARVKVGSAISS